MALDMPVTEPAPPPDRSRRVYVYWAAGLAFLAALGLFCWLVVGPVLSVDRALTDAYASPTPSNGAAAVAALGGQSEALRKLRVYYRMPHKGAPRKEEAVWLMGHCGEVALPDIQRAMQDGDYYVRRTAVGSLRGAGAAGVPDLIRALDDPDPEIRIRAVEGLGSLQAAALPSVPILKRLIHDGKAQPGTRKEMPHTDIKLAIVAAKALGEMGPVAREAIPELEWAVKDQWPGICQAAAAALMKIRAEESSPPPANQSPAP